jgi:hypothetical protein
MLINSPNISGSLTVTGNSVITGSLTVLGGINGAITGSATTASYVEYSNVANKPTLVSGSEQITYSGLSGIPSGIVSSSTQITGYNIFATTGSNQFDGSQAITGSLTVTGQVVAQTLNVQQVTSSIVFSSGSNIFGNSLGNTQQFTGSVSVTGSMTVNGASTFASSITSQLGSSGANFNSNAATTGAVNAYRVSNSTGVGSYGIESNAGNDLMTAGLSNATLLQSVSNTALQFGTQQIARMTITASGRVGIGNTVPVSALVVSTTSDTSSLGQSGILIQGADILTTGNVMALSFSAIPGTTRARAAVGSVVGADWGKGNLTFYTRDASDSSALSTADEKMRITSGGNVGIGTSNPATQLNVGHESHGIGFAYLGASSLPSIAGIFTSEGTAGGQTGYGSLLIKARSDFAPFYSIDFFTAASANTPVERMRITAGGNVGIGTLTPGYDGAGYGAVRYVSINNALGTGSNLELATGTTANDAYVGALDFINTSNTGAPGAGRYGIASIRAYTTNASATNTGGGYLTFNTKADGGSGAERMRITSGGSVGIGTDIPAARLQLNLTNAFPGTVLAGSGIGNAGNNFSIITTDAQGENVGGMITFGGMRNSDATNVGIFGGIRGGKENSTNGNTAGTLGFYTLQSAVAFAERMRIGSTGTITFNAYGAGTLSTSASGVISASDGRHKTKTRQIQNGLEIIHTLQPTYYKWNEDSPFASENEELGFIAQEIAEVIPEASPGVDEENKYRNYHDRAIIAMLVKGMQEQQSQIETLKSKIEILEQS